MEVLVELVMATICPFLKQLIHAGTAFMKSNRLFIGSAVKEGQLLIICPTGASLLGQCMILKYLTDIRVP